VDFEPNWKPDTNHPNLDLSRVLLDKAIEIVATEMHDVVDLFPFRNSSITRVRFDAGWLGIVLDFSQAPGMPAVGELDPKNIEALRAAAESTLKGTHQELKELIGSEYFSFSRFSYVGPWQDGKVSSSHLVSHLVAWINALLLPEVLRRNQARVLRAIPQPPRVDIGRIAKALCVLECEETSQQGTAFMLKGIGIVTCDHVLGPSTKAFRADHSADKYSVSVRKRESDIDLAILDVDDLSGEGLELGTADGLKQMDHLTICGYPNYRVGDSGTVVPGLVVGFRPVHGIRRILTNAAIIGGTSGGPVLDSSGKVIGIAVTGADRMESASETEDHGIVPVDALSFLRVPG